MSEGLWRLAIVVRGLGYLAAGGLCVLAAVSRPSLGEIALLLGAAAVIAGVGWVLGWILLGFAWRGE